MFHFVLLFAKIASAERYKYELYKPLNAAFTCFFIHLPFFQGYYSIPAVVS